MGLRGPDVRQVAWEVFSPLSDTPVGTCQVHALPRPTERALASRAGSTWWHFLGAIGIRFTDRETRGNLPQV